MSNNRYRAFISYSHKDTKWGNWVHKKLESYPLPKRLRVGRPDLTKTLYPIFRDREELPGSSDLGQNLSDALSQSNSLLVICSPNSAASQWVNEEVVSYQKLSPGKPVIALVVSGQDKAADANNFCLPKEVQRLRQTDSAILRYIDARKLGESKAVLLQLTSELAALPLPELQKEEKKRQHTRIGLSTIAAISLIAVLFGVLNYVQKAEQNRFIAETEKYTAIAEEASVRGDQNQAIRAALTALPKNLEEPERPLSDRAAAALNVVMSQPVKRIFKMKMKTQPVDMLATSNSQQWLIRDNLNQYHLYDAGKNIIVWSKGFGKVVQNGINKSGHLVIRTDNELVTVDPLNGKQRCKLKLNSHVSQLQQGSLEWLQKDWVIEWGYIDPNANYKFLNQITFIETTHCKADSTSTFGSAPASVYLIDVLDDGAKITASDMRDPNSNKDFVGFVLWPADQKQPVKLLAKLPGRLRSVVPGGLNNTDYNGPLLINDPIKHVSYLAQRAKDTKPYELFVFDWQQNKLIRRTTLPNRPLSLKWANKARKEILLEVAGKNIISNNTQIITAMTGALIHEVPSPASANLFDSRLTKVNPDLSYWVTDSDSGAQVANLNAKYTVQLSRSNSSALRVVGAGWIDALTAIQVLDDGNITILHVSDMKKGKQKLEPISISRYWAKLNNNRHLAVTGKGKFYWIDQGKKEFIFNYPYKHNKNFYGPFDDRYLVAKGFGDDENNMDLIDLKEKKIVFQKKLSYPVSLLSAKNDHLIYQNTKNQKVLVWYNKPDSPVVIAKNITETVAVSNDRQSIFTIRFKDAFSKDIKIFIKKTSVKNGEEEETSPDLAGPSNSLLYSVLIFPKDSKTFVIQPDKTEGTKKQKISVINLNTYQQSEIGLFDFSALGSLWAPKVGNNENLSGYIRFSSNQLFSGKADILVNTMTGSSTSFNPRKGQYLLLANGLLEHDQVLAYQDKEIKLINLNDQTSQEISCDVLHRDPQASSYYYFPKDDIIFIVSPTRVCAIERSTAYKVFDAELPRKMSALQDWHYHVALYRQPKKTSFTLVLGSGLTYDIDLKSNWKKLVTKARGLGLPALASAITPEANAQ